MSMLLAILVYLSFKKDRWSGRQGRPVEKKPEKEKEEKVKVRVSGGGRAVLWITS